MSTELGTVPCHRRALAAVAMALAVIVPLIGVGVATADPDDSGPPSATPTTSVDTTEVDVPTTTEVGATSTTETPSESTVVVTSVAVTSEVPTTSADDTEPSVPETTVGDTVVPELGGVMVMSAVLSVPPPTCSVAVELGAPWMPGTSCLEARLFDLGYFHGPADDLFGEDTAAAVSSYQADAGLAVDGRPGRATLESLEIWRNIPAPSCTVAVPLGAPWMPGTRCLEQQLRELGLFHQSPDDLFDWDTAVGVSLYQQSIGRFGTGAPTIDDLRSLGIWRDVAAPTCTVSIKLGAPWMPGTRCLEQALSDLGLFWQSPDDLFDWDTAVGVSLYQQSVGRVGTSNPTTNDLRSLGIWRDPPAPTCSVSQVPTSRAPAGTTCLETRLSQLGLFWHAPDGVYDWDTAVGVSLYRQSIGLPGSGDGDIATMISLGILTDPNPLPPNSGTGRRIVYSRGQQRIWAVESDGRVVKTHRVSGRLREPYAGTYSVYSRSLHTFAENNPSIRWMYMVRFAYGPSGGRIGFHEIPKQNGRPMQTHEQLGLPLSGGCVRQTTADAIWVWNWAPVGTKVVVL